MAVENNSSELRHYVGIGNPTPFSIKVFRNIILGVLAILGALTAFLALTGGFPDYFQPIDFSSLPTGGLAESANVMHYGFGADNLVPTVKRIPYTKRKAVYLTVNNGPKDWSGITFSWEENDLIPPNGAFRIRWRGNNDKYKILVDLTVGGGADDTLNSEGTNYYVYLAAPGDKWTTVSVPLSEFQLNPVQRPGAKNTEKFDPARLREVSFTFFPDTKATFQIETVRFSWDSSKLSSLIILGILLLFGLVLWRRTTESNILFRGKMEWSSSTVLARLVYILFAFALVAKIVSFSSADFTVESQIIYSLLFLSIAADEFFKDFMSDKPILTIRYGVILAAGWFLNFTLEPVELLLLLAITFIPMVLYKSRFLFIGLPVAAFLILFIHPVLGIADTVVPGGIMIGSLAFLAAFVRGTLEHGDAVREAGYVYSLYAEVLESTSDAVFLMDDTGRVDRVNKGFELLTGYAAIEGVGRNIASFIYPDDVSLLTLNRPPNTGTESRTYDARMVTKGGQIRSVLMREIPISREGRRIGYQIVATDISERKLAEEALRESEERFHSLFDNATIGIYRTTPDGRILMVNPAVIRMLGYSSLEELAQRNLETSGFEPEYSRREFRERLEREGVISGLESAWTRKDGSIMFVRESARAIKDSAGIVYYDGTFEDITEQKVAEEALRLTSFTVERASDSVYWMDPDGRFIDVNMAACESLGYTREELLSLRIEDIDPNISSDNWPDFWESLKAARSRIHEVTHRAKDGRTFPVEIRSNYMKFGGRELICAFGRDITERKRSEEASAHLAAIVDSSSDAIIGKDLDGIITSWNMGAQRTYGYSPDEAIGRSISILAPDGYKDEIPRLMEKIKQGGEIAHYDTVRARKDGKLIDVSITLSPIKNTSGEISGVSTVARDVSDNKRIERALRESEEQNRAIINAVPDILFRVSREGVLLDFRAPDESVLYLQPGAFLGKSIVEVMPSNVWEPALKAIGKAIETDMIQTFEYELPMAGEGIKFYEDRTVKLSENEALSVIRDITERKQAEKALTESEMKYRSLFTSSPETIFIINPAGVIIDCNPAAETVSGRKRDELVGKKFRELNFAFLGNSLERLERAFTDIMSERHVAPFEIELQRDDNNVFWFSLSASLLRRDGKVHAVQVIISNITKRKQAEESLRQMNSFNEMLIKTLPFGISIVDGSGNILFMSDKLKENFGADMLGKKCWIAYKDDMKQCRGCPLLDEIGIGKSKVIESDGVLGGRTFQISHTGLIYNEQKAVLEVFEDVTERKQLQIQFLQAQKMESLGTLASGIAHDFNNILGIILGHSSLIEEKLGEGDELSKSFSSIVKAADRGAALVRQMLTFARKTNISFSSISINESVKEIQELFDEAFPKTMTLSCRFSPDLPEIRGDSTQIHQALLNLCVNARDAMSGSGMLNISTRLISGSSLRARHHNAAFAQYVLLEVMDTGVGMDEETLQHIFEPFFTTKELGKGTGLGLSVAFGIMENHDGFIDVQSEIGKGTTFYLYFPVKSSHPELNGEDMTDKETTGGKEKILIIEDEEMLRDLAREVLASKGYEVITAVDGEEGINVFTKNQHDIKLVVSDLGLPKLSGKDVLKKVKSINPAVKFIVATGFIDPEEKSDIFRSGASDIVPKPYTPKDLSMKVREVLDA